jgi:hypothetical protein
MFVFLVSHNRDKNRGHIVNLPLITSNSEALSYELISFLCHFILLSSKSSLQHCGSNIHTLSYSPNWSYLRLSQRWQWRDLSSRTFNGLHGVISQKRELSFRAVCQPNLLCISNFSVRATCLASFILLRNEVASFVSVTPFPVPAWRDVTFGCLKLAIHHIRSHSRNVEASSHIHNPMIRDALMARDPFIMLEKHIVVEY